MRHALILVSWLMVTVAAQAADPDIYLIGYELFIPNEHFSDIAGPDRPLMTTINSEAEWQKLWATLEPKMGRTLAQLNSNIPYPLPAIDFSRHSLLVAALGSGGGESVAIRSVRNVGSEVIVSLISLHPGPNCMVTTQVKYPIALALIPRTDKPVRFGVTSATFGCGDAAH